MPNGSAHLTGFEYDSISLTLFESFSCEETLIACEGGEISPRIKDDGKAADCA
ncbi:MAG: hypothetical protein ABR956_18675 [Terracidiphilus sp.]